VSIHQNSYTSSDIKGAQVFYYSHSEEGKRAAEIMQKALLSVDSDNSREAKANDSYYLLTKTKTPVIIVECGFLSNSKEEKLLADEEYQSKIAFSIYTGIMEYFNVIGKSC
jgi:N-acetylmuramoyl-L-alanine amidase